MEKNDIYCKVQNEYGSEGTGVIKFNDQKG